MRLSIGQPESLWQNGTPQSMQRAPCVRSSTSAGGVKISRKSCTRSNGSRYGTAWRSNSLKPVGLPIDAWLCLTVVVSPSSRRDEYSVAVVEAVTRRLRLDEFVPISFLPTRV